MDIVSPCLTYQFKAKPVRKDLCGFPSPRHRPQGTPATPTKAHWVVPMVWPNQTIEISTVAIFPQYRFVKDGYRALEKKRHSMLSSKTLNNASTLHPYNRQKGWNGAYCLVQMTWVPFEPWWSLRWCLGQTTRSSGKWRPAGSSTSAKKTRSVKLKICRITCENSWVWVSACPKAEQSAKMAIWRGRSTRCRCSLLYMYRIFKSTIESCRIKKVSREFKR